jgi:hypothetical protein
MIEALLPWELLHPWRVGELLNVTGHLLVLFPRATSD